MFKWFGKVNYSPYTKVTDFARHLKDDTMNLGSSRDWLIMLLVGLGLMAVILLATAVIAVAA